MAKKVVVSKAGYDALSESNPNNLIFSSDYNTFKIIAEGTITSQTVSANPTTIQLAHGQGQVPAIFAFAKFPDGYVALPNQKERADALPPDRYWVVEMDSTNIYFMFYKGGTANYNVDIKYYIFEAPI